MKAQNWLMRFDPQKLGRYEKDNYVAYYQKDWMKLLRASVGMVKEAFGLSLPQAIYGAYLVARAEIAFAPFPDNNVPLAVVYSARFYRFVQRIHHLDLDIERVAHQEVNWWSIHRKLFGQPENQELVEAVAQLYAAIYKAPSTGFYDAAYHRAKGMLFSDQWVNSGKDPASPLLIEEEDELVKGYAALKTALTLNPIFPLVS